MPHKMLSKKFCYKTPQTYIALRLNIFYFYISRRTCEGMREVCCLVVFFLFISRDLIAGPNCLFNAYIYEEQRTNYFKVSFCVM